MEWKELKIKNMQDKELYCKHRFHSEEAPNVIYVQTPIGSVDSEMAKAFEPLCSYPLNIFCVDPYGIGKSEGEDHELTKESFVEDLNAVQHYIGDNFSDNIHLFASTGTGGILGQYYASRAKGLKSLVQYGAAIHGDTRPLGPKPLMSTMRHLLGALAALFPRMRMNFPVPKYSGHNADLDNSFYTMLKKSDKKIFHLPLSFMKMLLDILLSPGSAIKSQQSAPTLVFKMNHDRYFPAVYYQDYFDSLKVDKKLIIIDDIHNSYYFRAEEVCHEAAQWILSKG